MRVSVKLLGDFAFSIKNTKFEMVIPDSLNVKDAVCNIFEFMEKNGDSMNPEDVIVALDGAVLAPDKWEDLIVKEGQEFTFIPPLLGG